MPRPRILQRTLNGVRKLAAGLTLRGESIWPGVRNDLYVAHLSIYHFFRLFVSGRRVLDVASGSGYGSAYLAEAANSVVGVDLDRRNVRYARRTLQKSNLRFIAGDAEFLGEYLPGQRFDVIASSNTLEHLDYPARFVAVARQLVVDDGLLLVAVPPIRSASERAANDAIPYHRSNLSVQEWAALFESWGWTVTPYLHRFTPGEHTLDFGSPYPSKARPEDFSFTQTDLCGLATQPTLTAIFLLRPSVPGLLEVPGNIEQDVKRS